MDPTGDASGSNTAIGNPVNMVKVSQNIEQEPNASVKQSTVTASNQTKIKNEADR